eukprot:1395484-Amorphochlora_amoeboformis.AAC.2
MARGHRIEQVPEIPLVVPDKMEGVEKTKEAVAFLKSIGAYDDVERVKDSRKIRPGKGKLRNRRHVMKRGPLVIYANDEGCTKGFRNISGVEVASVDTLNLLQLAPGGHLGRFIIWSEAAFNKLSDIWGSTKRESTAKKGYKLPYTCITNSDIGRIINSAEIQGHKSLNPAKAAPRTHLKKRNPLRNKAVMDSLNPYAVEMRKTEQMRQQAAKNDRKGILAKRRAAQKANRIQRKVNYAKIHTDYTVLTKSDLDQKIASDAAERKRLIEEEAARKLAEEEAERKMLADKEASKKAKTAAAESKAPVEEDDEDDDDDDDDDDDE